MASDTTAHGHTKIAPNIPIWDPSISPAADKETASSSAPRDGLLHAQEAASIVTEDGETLLKTPGYMRRCLKRKVRETRENHPQVVSINSQVQRKQDHLKGVLNNAEFPRGSKYSNRRYYVLTNAGKPVFSSSDEDNVTNITGVAHALISVLAENNDKLRCLIKGHCRIAFLDRTPLHLFCVSDWGEPEYVLRSHLDYIHQYVQSIIPPGQILKTLQQRSNSDLSRLLEGMFAQYDPNYLTSALQPLKMPSTIRNLAAAALMPPSKVKSLLYILMVAEGHIITLLRPRKHTIHPSDEVSLIFVSTDQEAFPKMRELKETICHSLKSDKTLDRIRESINTHSFSASAIECPDLRHFIYKSRQYVQVTYPQWEPLYKDNSDQLRRLVTLYQKLQDGIHARSGQISCVEVLYLGTDCEACFAWVTKSFEIYICVSPQLPISTVISITRCSGLLSLCSTPYTLIHPSAQEQVITEHPY
ncbi:uncharacterized protein L203_103896 [Cryptococcus depauperatus CBS 7841]|uniref:Vacuolar fusion protein MON1 n=1 Tax=Cryptococcus depauperatus CBS 7841 TaxID=1295531 RepID=A0AAJ8JUE5_9TREE